MNFSDTHFGKCLNHVLTILTILVRISKMVKLACILRILRNFFDKFYADCRPDAISVSRLLQQAWGILDPSSIKKNTHQTPTMKHRASYLYHILKYFSEFCLAFFIIKMYLSGKIPALLYFEKKNAIPFTELYNSNLVNYYNY